MTESSLVHWNSALCSIKGVPRAAFYRNDVGQELGPGTRRRCKRREASAQFVRSFTGIQTILSLCVASLKAFPNALQISFSFSMLSDISRVNKPLRCSKCFYVLMLLYI